MNTFLSAMTRGRIAPKVKVGQLWILDGEENNWLFPFNRKNLVKVIYVNDKYVEYVTKYGETRLSRINNFRYDHTLVIDVEK